PAALVDQPAHGAERERERLGPHVAHAHADAAAARELGDARAHDARADQAQRRDLPWLDAAIRDRRLLGALRDQEHADQVLAHRTHHELADALLEPRGFLHRLADACAHHLDGGERGGIVTAAAPDG